MQHAEIQRAVSILKRGGLVAFPTETVYGLGARVFDPSAVRRIFEVKGRPQDNPLIVHVAGPDQVRSVAADTPPIAETAMRAFWPGPLTVILRRSSAVPAVVSAGLDTVAVRMPDHTVALDLIRELGEPIAAPSANRSGRPSPTRADHVRNELRTDVELILDGGPCRVGLESTVLDLTSARPRVLRPGSVTVQALRPVIGEVEVLGSVSEGDSLGSPGLRHRHYAPGFRLILVPPEGWEAALTEWEKSDRRVGLLCPRQAKRQGAFAYRRVFEDERDLARGLYEALLEAETAGVEVLLVQTLEKRGLGAAIMDRLERASETGERTG